MKILLVQPAKPHKALGGEDFSIFEPLALEYLAAGVVNDHEVRILDMRLDPDLDAVLQNYQPDVVGITAYTVHVNTVKRLFQQIKALNPEIVTMVGGHHATVRPEDFHAPGIDVIVVGEGVLPFREVVSKLEKHLPLSDIPGLVGLGDGAVMIDQGDQGLDLDAMPFPRRDLTAAYRKSYFSEWMRPLASIRTSKGCHFRCQFCALWKLSGGRYFTRQPERIVEELAAIQEKYVFFADDESLLDTERMGVLADLIQRAGIDKRFFLYGRSDTIARHPELLEKWKKAGLERVFVGLECICDADLKMIRKGSTVENNLSAVRILKELDIDIWPMFLVRPEFDRQDFADLRKYCLSLDLPFIGFSVLTPLPGTDLYDEVKGHMITSNYDYFDFFHTLLPTTLPAPDFYQELATLFKRSRSLKNQLRLMGKYRLRDLPSLFKAYGGLMARLKNLAEDYAV
jgi:hopanoid C-3 methylase